MANSDFDKIDWGLIDRYFDIYGLYGMANKQLELSQELIGRLRKEGIQLIFYGIILGLFINFAATRLYDAVSSLGQVVLDSFWLAFSIIAMGSTWLFLKSALAITHREVFRTDREGELVHRYFNDLIRKGLTEDVLWYELVRRKYHK